MIGEVYFLSVVCGELIDFYEFGENLVVILFDFVKVGFL